MRTLVKLDLTQTAMKELKAVFHNRFHPDIPPAATVKSGEVFRIECFDFSGGQIKNDDDPSDIRDMDLSVAHILSGPVAVEGAEPGDAVEVEILDIQPFPERSWGITALVGGGAGFLGDVVDGPCKAVWEIEGIFASSRHIPGVRFPGIPHMGIIATAPSSELLSEWNRRENELQASNTSVPMVFPPTSEGAMVGSLSWPKGTEAREDGARTIPPRENGGNCDIKNLSRGAKVYLPVYVKGANVSYGDIHFSQGDGEIALCGGIEMSGIVISSIRVIKDGIRKLSLTMPMYIPGPVEPRFTKYLTFEGIPVDESGKQHFLDPRVGFRQACLNAVKYLTGFGYSKEQAVLILSAAPCEGRIANIVDTPNSMSTLGIPAEIFDFDILPKRDGENNPIVQDRSKALATL